MAGDSSGYTTVSRMVEPFVPLKQEGRMARPAPEEAGAKSDISRTRENGLMFTREA